MHILIYQKFDDINCKNLNNIEFYNNIKTININNIEQNNKNNIIEDKNTIIDKKEEINSDLDNSSELSFGINFEQNEDNNNYILLFEKMDELKLGYENPNIKKNNNIIEVKDKYIKNSKTIQLLEEKKARKRKNSDCES